MEYVIDNNIKVSNNSWGGGGYSQALYDVIEASQAIGHIFVAAAGNNSEDNDETPYYPASFNLPNIITVAATDSNDDLAYFSNYGATTVDLGAPGVNIFSTVLAADYDYKTGTSMATPHVTGVVALLRSRLPDTPWHLIRDLVLTTARPIDSLAGITVTGGVVNARAAVGDCNGNDVPDDADIVAGTSEDCTGNGVPDECEADCNGSGAADSCDLAFGTSADCNYSAIPDECEPGGDQDCNTNGIPDLCDIYDAFSSDCNRNAMPDECEPDCNGSGTPDNCDIVAGTSVDCNTNNLPDECDIDGDVWPDLDDNGVPDSCEAEVLFVDADAIGLRNGLNWTNAFADLQRALDIAAEPTNAAGQIWVAAGTYVPTRTRQPDCCPRTAAFHLVDGVTLYGGFAGGEADLAERDPTVNETILSGDLNGDDVFFPGSSCCNSHPEPGCDDSACATAICTYQPACCDVEWDDDCSESAFYACPQVCDRQMDDNAYHVVASIGNMPTAVLDGFTATAGNADGEDGCLWSDNSGGGMHISVSAATVRNGVFTRNFAAGSFGKGGGVFVAHDASPEFGRPSLTNCTFTENWAISRGGGLANDDGEPVVEDCVFIGNYGNYGGGVCNEGEPIEVSNCTFVGNSARNGGGMFDFEASQCHNCVFIGNTAVYSGGGMSFITSEARIVNSTFAGNSALSGNALGFHTNPSSMGGNATIANSILWDGGDGEEVVIGDSSTVSISYSSIRGGWEGTGNISVDPLFSDIGGDDGIVGTLDDNVRLSAGSPCIDAGANSLVPDELTADLDGTTRLIDDPFTPNTGSGTPPIVDLGAFEYADCNGNLIADWEDIDAGTSADCTGNGIPDECEPDCNDNETADSCDIADGVSLDCDRRGVPDECQPDCDEDETPDVCELPPFGGGVDCNDNGVPDTCDVAEGGSDDCNDNTIPDNCEADCNANAVADGCDIAEGTSDDCTLNSVPDECETLPDCDGNGIADFNDICNGTGEDADHNGVPDGCDVILFVDEEAAGDNNGSSWADAFNDLQDAFDLAADPESEVTEIWVANGTYRPSAQTDPEDPRTATWQLITGVAIYGGFAGGETLLDGRDPFLNETILSGDLAGRAAAGGRAYWGENSYHVVTGSGTDASAVLDGFTITAGFASGAAPHNRGGGVYNDRGDPTLVNCTIAANTTDGCTCGSYGAGVYNSHASPTLIKCVIERNVGDGMYNYFSDPILVGCKFIGNTNRALYNRTSSPLLINCVLNGNSTPYHGAVMYGTSPGAVSTPTLIGCTIVNNTAAYYGGGIVSGSLGDTNPTLVNCILWSNGGAEEFDQIRGGVPNISHSCIQGWSGVFGGVGNTGADPLFADAAGSDGFPGTADDDLRLAIGSPCIDAGDNWAMPADDADVDGDHNTDEPVPLDFEGTPRFFDDPFSADAGYGVAPIVDMGASEYGDDCNNNEVPDDVDIADGTCQDCTGNGIPDECERDCNGNGVADSCDILEGTGGDCNGNGIPDDCLELELDCNDNLHPDACDLADGTSSDCNDSGVPDECEPDCNGNGITDSCDIADGTSQDCNDNNRPDECDLDTGYSPDCDGDVVPDECEDTSADCNSDGIWDPCDIAEGTSHDCNASGVPDECEADCNFNGLADECDLAGGTSADANGNGVPDECELAPLTAPYPHDAPKNRYISFSPNNTAIVAFRVELTASAYFPSSTGVLGWVGEPDANGAARVVVEPHYRVWSRSLIHVGDCEIVPVATYAIRTTAEGAVFSEALVVETIEKPGFNLWADCVGPLGSFCDGDSRNPACDPDDSACPMGQPCEAVWTPPEGHTNFNDVSAAVFAFQELPGTVWPPVTWVDLHGNDFGDATVDPPNYRVNFSDIQQIVLAFQGNPYPFSDPADCPDAPDPSR